MLLNRLRCLIPSLLTSYTHTMWNDWIGAVQVKREHTSSLSTYRFFGDPLPTDVRSSWMKSYCNEGQVIVLYLAPLLFCTLCVSVVNCALPWARCWYFSHVSLHWGGGGGSTMWINCQNVFTFTMFTDARECEKYLKFVVFDLYIPWLVSSASINDCLNKKVHLLNDTC